MSKDEFEQQLRRDGYLDIKHRHIERGVDSQPHCHDFDTRLLVEEGELTIVSADAQRTYRAGDILELTAGVEHRECYTPEPLRYVAGLRRYSAAP